MQKPSLAAIVVEYMFLFFPQDIGASPVIIGKAIAGSVPAGRRVFPILVGGGEENYSGVGGLEGKGKGG